MYLFNLGDGNGDGLFNYIIYLIIHISYLILNTFSQSLSIPSDIAPYAYTSCTITCQLISSRSQDTATVSVVRTLSGHCQDSPRDAELSSVLRS